MRIIKKGDMFECIKSVIMNSKDGETAYIKGNQYLSEADGKITNEQGNVSHWWCDTNTLVTSKQFEEHFVAISQSTIKNFQKQIDQLIASRTEAERFISKVDAAIERLNSNDNCHSTKEMAAARRAALDLKRELTNVNQLQMWI